MGHHHHGSSDIKNIKIAFFLNFFFTIIEFIGGVLTNSTAILADAVHDLGDSFALAQAWYFQKLSYKGSNKHYTYGYNRFSLLGAIISISFLFISSIYVLSEVIPRLLNPEPVHAFGMLFLSFFGIAANGYAIKNLIKNRGINSRAVALHLMEDLLGWIAVLVVSIIMLFIDLPILDPILALLITIYILINIVKNIRKTVPIFLQAAPKEHNIENIIKNLEQIEYVHSLHHVRLWSLDEDHPIFSAHITINKSLDECEYIELKKQIKIDLRKFNFKEVTLEIEFPNEICRIEDDKIKV